MRPMFARKLDRYVTRLFLASFGVSLLLFVGLFILVDFCSRLDDLEDAGRRAGGLSEAIEVLASYYLTSTPLIFHQTAPFLTLMAAMFTLVRLRRGNELVPMMAGGVSLHRIMLPFFVFGALVALLMVASQEWIVPKVAEDRLRLRSYFQRGGEMIKNIDLIRDAERNVFHVARYDRLQRTMFDFCMWHRENLPDGRSAMAREVRADAAQYRAGPMGTGWYLKNGRERLFRPEGPEERVVDSLTGTELLPSDLELREAERLHLSFTELKRLFHQNPDQRSLRVLLHFHLTYPLSTLVLLLLGMPFVFRERHRSPMVGIGVCLMLSAIYFVLDLVLRDLGNRGSLHPVVATWLPLLLFGSVGATAYDAMKT